MRDGAVTVPPARWLYATQRSVSRSSGCSTARAASARVRASCGLERRCDELVGEFLVERVMTDQEPMVDRRVEHLGQDPRIEARRELAVVDASLDQRDDRRVAVVEEALTEHRA